MLALLTASCHRRPSAPVIPPPSSTTAVLAEYSAGEKSFESGDYLAAARSYEAYLDTNPLQNRDRALFRAGLAYELAGGSVQYRKRSRLDFERLVAEFPKSPYAIQARFILSLEGEIEKLNGDLKEQQIRIKALTEELQRLKSIDMQRRPSRPPN